MEALREHRWKLLIAIGILCLLVVGALLYAHATTSSNVSGEGTTEVEPVDPSQIFDDDTTYEFPEI